jgi:alkylation response protein AidB-like acyl-CoA dehydrogenase
MTGLDEFRRDVVRFLSKATADGRACPAYGAILSPGLYDQAVVWQRYCAAEGFAGIHWPEAYGGRGLTRDHAAVWYEECARASIAPYLNLQGIVLAGEAILRAGTDRQKERLLAPTLRAEIVWCQLFSEPGAGSDLAGLQTKAVRDGDRYVVNGQKVWSSNADVADFGILLARTSEDRPAHKGLSFFCYDMSLPGTEVRPLRQMTGDAEFCEVFLTDVDLPTDARLGDEHEGWRVAMAVLEDERGSFGAAGAIALNQRLAELSPNLEAGDPVIRDRFAGLMASGAALGQLLTRCDGDPSMAPVAKVMRSELDSAAVNSELHTSSAWSMVLDSPSASGGHRALVERFLYSPGMRIAGGSSEIQRNIIGERLLDLPREPR